MGSKMIRYFPAREASQALPVDGKVKIKSTFSASENTVIFVTPAVLFLRNLQQWEPEMYQWKEGTVLSLTFA